MRPAKTETTTVSAPETTTVGIFQTVPIVVDEMYDVCRLMVLVAGSQPVLAACR